MHSVVARLLSISGKATANPIGMDECIQYVDRFGVLGKELAELLSVRNGFYAFESALLIRPLRNQGTPSGLLEWNDPGSWKGQYMDSMTDILFFAEDVFGGQFGIRSGSVCTFDPETGALEVSHSSLGEWAKDLLDGYEFRTGYPLAHSWQAENTPLQPGMRLLPKIPFVFGGKYEIENLYPVDDLKGMLFRLYSQTDPRSSRRLPNCSQSSRGESGA